VDVLNISSTHCRYHILARLVKKEFKGPLEIKIGTKSVRICMCGLSINQPYCDNTHKKTIDEDDDKTYAYEKENDDRIEVKNWEVTF
jgi:CDGSH-type Zn-finger protein